MNIFTTHIRYLSSKTKSLFEIDIKVLDILLNNYIDYSSNINNINQKLTNKKIRNINFPSEISENLVRIILKDKYNKLTSWNIKKGDLTNNKEKLEVKCFSSNGPSSFGPTEIWDTLYFVNAINYKEKKFKVYEINLSNKNNIWKNLKINNKQTFEDQCKQKRRPRLLFNNIQKQLDKKYINKIFDGYISDLKEQKK
jgi:hypothetical protein